MQTLIRVLENVSFILGNLLGKCFRVNRSKVDSEINS